MVEFGDRPPIVGEEEILRLQKLTVSAAGMLEKALALSLPRVGDYLLRVSDFTLKEAEAAQVGPRLACLVRGWRSPARFGPDSGPPLRLPGDLAWTGTCAPAAWLTLFCTDWLLTANWKYGGGRRHAATCAVTLTAGSPRWSKKK